MTTATTAPAKPRRETWLDWIEPGSPEPPLITRNELVERLQVEGVDVSARSLVYWESKGILPRAVRRWRAGAPQALYPLSAINAVRTLRMLQKAGNDLRDIRETLRTAWDGGEAPPLTQEERTALSSEFQAKVLALRPHLRELSRLQEQITGVRVVGAEIQLINTSGQRLRIDPGMHQLDDR